MHALSSSQTNGVVTWLGALEAYRARTGRLVILPRSGERLPTGLSWDGLRL
jgi:hypothetical protein